MNRPLQPPAPSPQPADLSRRGLLARLDPRAGRNWPWSARQQAPSPDVCDSYDT